MIAKVIVDIALDREFDYAVPPELEPAVRVGVRVHVPFGRRYASGYVVGLAAHSSHPRLRPIAAVAGDRPYLSDRLIELARWMSEYYCAPVEQAIRAVLPGAIRRRGARFKTCAWVRLTEAARPERDDKLSDRQRRIVERLRAGPAPLADLRRELGVSAAPVRALQKKGWVELAERTVERAPLAGREILRTEPLTLTPAQAQALAAVTQRIDGGNGGVVLLYGVTGSGKTEVYLQAIRHTLARGGGAIVLVPEIALTPQTVERFHSRFGNRVAVLHSHLSEGERHDEWHRIRDGGADIVVGARSAVFAPVPRLGLIVVDEEHEPTYKQEEAPRYSARDVAVMRGRLERCAVVLGSATPSLESWHNARSGKYALACLPERADNRRMPAVRIVDLRLETERQGRGAIFSRELLEAMRLRLERREQTILFLNRRGYATTLLCPRCGHVARCDHCSVSCTYHRTDETMRCHICGRSRPAPVRCPQCQDPAFKFTGVGTQKVEAAAAKCFPQARIARIDADVTTRRDAYDRIFGEFRSGRTDILIGTQMIAKGLHFPNVTLVGVIYADLSLHLPDFRAGERTFQLLAQVAGRAGRGEVAGEVIVQTYTPFHAAVQAARRQDYPAFCDQEEEFRRELNYPPFSHLVCLTLRGASEERVRYCATALAQRLAAAVRPDVTVAEASPAPLARAKGLYRYQVLMRCRSTRAMTEPLKQTLSAFKLPSDVALAVDVDALNLL